MAPPTASGGSHPGSPGGPRQHLSGRFVTSPTVPMKALVLAALVSLTAVAGCIGTDPDADVATDGTYDALFTAFLLPDVITGLDELVLLDDSGSAAGVWIDETRNLLLASHHGNGLSITDISDPSNAKMLGLLADFYARDVDFMEWNGTNYAILAGGGQGIHVVNIDDPYNPILVFTAEDHASHNVATVPGTPYVFNAQPYVKDRLGSNVPSNPVTGVGPTPLDTDRGSTILDISEGTNGTWTEIPFPADWDGVPLTSNGCHDVTVRMDLGLAFCAGGGYEYREGGGETFIWDISKDVLAPKFIGMADNPFIVYHHQAIPSEDGNYLHLNDEHIFPNCQRADTAAGTVGQPTAAMWVYDIRDRTDPQLVSWLQAPDPAGPVPDPDGNCGSHFGDIIDGTEYLVWGWYAGGTLLIDATDKANPVIVEQVAPHGSIWDSRYHNGHVYSGDAGISVLRVV